MEVVTIFNVASLSVIPGGGDGVNGDGVDGVHSDRCKLQARKSRDPGILSQPKSWNF